jgi:hypothetical protein
MTLAEAQKCLIDKLHSALAGHGFRKSAGATLLRKGGDNIWHVLSFGLKKRESGGFSFGCGVGIRFEQIEKIIGRSDDFPNKTTIGLPIHLLRKDQKYDEWFFANITRIDPIICEVVLEVIAYAVPFFQNYSSLQSVRHQLEKEQPSFWLGRDELERVKILSAIIFLNDGREEALSFLANSLEMIHIASNIYKSELLRVKKRLLIS